MPRRPDEAEIHEFLLQLDRLEEIREDLLDLGLSTLAEVEARIDELNRQLDALDDAPSSLEDKEKPR